MCISATIIAGASLALAAVGTAVAIDGSIKQAGYAEIQLAEQQKALRQQREQERLAAQEAEAARLDEFNRQRSANLAALAASGIGQHMSFMQGIAPAEDKALNYDLRNIRIGLLGNENRLASDIRVNRLESRINRSNRNRAVVGSLVDFAGSALSAGKYYNDNRKG